MASLYEQHVSQLQARAEQALVHCEYDHLIIGSGHSEQRFLDDYYTPFKPNPHFAQWVPLKDKPHCWLLVRPQLKPILFYYQPNDFWHLVEKLPNTEWTQLFDVRVYENDNDVNTMFDQLTGRGALISPPKSGANVWCCSQNPTDLLNHLHFKRAFKTEWEQHNLREANKIAVLGHNAAKQSFFAGESEFQIHQAYLSATQQPEKELPYGNIIALNEHASILHYQYQQVQKNAQPLSLLIDAGASYAGYAADITRTVPQPHANTVFTDLVRAVDQAQKSLISSIRHGDDYVELHQLMRLKLASILAESNIVHLDKEAQLETNVIGTFFPHGLGHLLGLQVHDIGGFQQTLSGQTKLAPQHSPALRLTRVLSSNMVITIEPGLYFIEALLQNLANGDYQKYINWPLVKLLKPYGGIRIEDNLLVTNTGSENFTRDAFEGMSERVVS